MTNWRGYARSQGGYTLVEVLITIALTALLMTALTSVVFTSVRAVDVASSRVEASSQIRNFQYFADDDFAQSAVPVGGSCGTPSTPCSTQPVVLSGTQVTNSVQPAGSAVVVTYTWDGSNFLDRQVSAGPPIHAATNVSAFSWYVDTTASRPTVVVSITVTVSSYSESQTFRFYPRVSP
jgi:prepilin-type N-terminal cleavage/methylation domain-containing protein